MAEKPDWVRGLDRPRGIETRRMRGKWRLCERSWRYDPKTGRSRKVSGRYLGKITPEGLVPSAGRDCGPSANVNQFEPSVVLVA